MVHQYEWSSNAQIAKLSRQKFGKPFAYRVVEALKIHGELYRMH